MAAPRINLKSIVPLGKQAAKGRLRQIQLAVQAAWKLEANNAGLNTTRAAYRRAVRLGPNDGETATVVLEGTIPNMIEQGMGPEGVGSSGSYDIRKMVLKFGTRSLRRKKDGGLYVNIPFRHSIGGIRGMDKGEFGKGQSPKSALEAIREIPPSVSTKGGATKWGGRLGEGYHRHLTGAVRMESTYSTSGKPQSQIRTWRRMSTSGKPWWHPGIDGRHLALIVVTRHVPQIMRGV